MRSAPLFVLALCASFLGMSFLAGCGNSGGAGVTAPISGTAALTFSSTTLTFASTTVGSTSATQTATLSSTGTGTATVSISSVTLSDTTDYSLTSTCNGAYGPGTSCTLTVAFTPKSAATLPATISIADNLTGSPQTIALTGTGTTAPAPSLSLSSSILTFATTAVGSSAAAQTVTLTNLGNATLSLNGVTLSDTTDYAMSSTCGASLAAGSSCVLSVTFTPKSAASFPASITISDNASNSPQTISLSGTGGSADITLSTSSLTFTSTPGVQSAAQVITVTNTGTVAAGPLSLFVGSAAPFSPTTTCNSAVGSSLSVGASCTLTVTFTPSSTGTYTSSVGFSDNASNSPQTVTLTGTGVAPAVTLSATNLTFPSTTIGATSAAQTVTLTNSGTAALTIGSIALGGTNASNFAETNNCPASLAMSASCTLNVTFSPVAASTYSATITLTDNAANSPQTIALTGTGTAATVTRTLYTFPAAFPESLPDASVNQLYALINNAQKSIDMTMYELVDTTFSADLVNACTRGVKVRVLLDASLEKSSNTAAYNQLNTAGSNCSAVFSNTAFQATHEKSIQIDGVTSVIMTLNLTSRYYTTTRDFALVENDAADYAAIEATFNADYAAGTPYGGTQGASDVSYTPVLGDDLIWSPTTAQAAMLGIINNATSTLSIENEELSSSTNSTIVAALTGACQRGVVVHFTIVDSSSYEPQFTTLKNAGCSVHTYPDTNTGFYVHAKVVVADYGLSTQNVYMGSINYSSASMNQNRELGLYLSDNAAVQTLYSTLNSDYAGGTPW